VEQKISFQSTFFDLGDVSLEQKWQQSQKKRILCPQRKGVYIFATLLSQQKSEGYNNGLVWMQIG
jgi:hypothetical protein